MTTEELGEVKRAFKPGLENVVAGIIIGLLLTAAGCAAIYFPIMGVIENSGNLPFWRQKEPGWSWGAVGIVATFGAFLAVIGVLFIWAMRSLRSLVVRVCQNGISITSRGTQQAFGWDDIASVQETHLYERPPILKGVAKYALPTQKSRSFKVKLREGEPFEFNGTAVKGHGALAKMIKEQTDPRSIPWKIVEEHAN
jgi:hypothetical protein